MPFSEETLATVNQITSQPLEFAVSTGLRGSLMANAQPTPEEAAALRLIHKAAFMTRVILEEMDRTKAYPVGSGPGSAQELSKDDVAGLQELLPHINHPGLRARIYERMRCCQAGQKILFAVEAARFYLQYASEQSSHTEKLDALGRAAHITHLPGNPLAVCSEQNSAAHTALLDLARNAAVPPLQRGRALNHLLLEQVPLTEEITQICEQLIQGFASEPHNQNYMLGIKQGFLQLQGNAQAAHQVALQQVENEILVGDRLVAQGQDVAAKHQYLHCIRKLQQLRAPQEKIDEVNRKDFSLNEKIMGSMLPLMEDLSMDRAEMKEKMVDFTNMDLATAARQFAAIKAVPDVPQQRPQIQQSPGGPEQISSLSDRFFSTSTVLGAQANVTHNGADSAEPDYPIADMMRLSSIHAALTLSVIRELIAEKNPSIEFFLQAVQDSPIIIRHHKEVFALALQRYLLGDDLIACHLLVPRIEEALRQTLVIRGSIPRNLNSNEVQQSHLLEALLRGPNLQTLTDFFGDDLMADLRRVLLAKNLNLRNALAHGLESDMYFSIWPGIVLNHVAWRLVFGNHPGLQPQRAVN